MFSKVSVVRVNYFAQRVIPPAACRVGSCNASSFLFLSLYIYVKKGVRGANQQKAATVLPDRTAAT